jgi:hypothetical protein
MHDKYELIYDTLFRVLIFSVAILNSINFTYVFFIVQTYLITP